MDILTDNGFLNLVRIKLAHSALIPSYVLEADLGVIKEAAVASVCDSEFAEPVGRQYPITDKASIWLSAAYFAKTASERGGKMSPAAEFTMGNIKSAAEVYGIEKDVEAIMSAYFDKKAEAPEEIYAWRAGGESKYPLHTAELTKTAMSYFEANRDKYPFDMRRTIAENIYKRACTLNMEATDTVRKEAGIGYPSRTEALRMLEDRKNRLSGFNKDASEKVAGAIKVLSTCTTDELMKALDNCARTVEFTDKVAGFRYIGRGDSTKLVERPCDAFFAISPKQASELGCRYVKLATTVIDCEKLAKEVPLEELDAVFHKDYCRDSFVKLSNAGKLSVSDSSTKVAYMIISEMSDADRNTLEAHLKSL